MSATSHSGSTCLAGQSAVVTGASSGIGRGIAAALARAGARVVVNYHRDEAGARSLVGEIVSAGGEAIAGRADVSREDEAVDLIATAVNHFGSLDILVCNAGIQRDAPFQEMSLEDWQRVIDVNLTGQFLCMREAVRVFLRQGVRPELSRAAGKIICISSVHELIPWAGHANYAASKGAVALLMKSVAQEVARRKIRVNSIAPGAIKTPINRQAWETAAARKELLQLIPYDRIGEVDDVAKAAVWLASDDADYVHGTTLYIDGGCLLYPAFETGRG